MSPKKELLFPVAIQSSKWANLKRKVCELVDLNVLILFDKHFKGDLMNFLLTPLSWLEDQDPKDWYPSLPYLALHKIPKQTIKYKKTDERL